MKYTTRDKCHTFIRVGGTIFTGKSIGIQRNHFGKFVLIQE
jgi:hypothetical protein